MGRLRGCLWLTAGLVVALLAGVVAFMTLSRATATQQAPEATEGTTGPTVQVVVAARAVTVRAALSSDDLATKDLPVEAVPAGAVSEIEEALGKITLVDLYPGEIILSQRLIDPNEITGDGRYALVIAEDEVLMAFPAGDLMSRSNVLKPGDQVDLLFTMSLPTSRGPVAPGGEAGSEEEEQFTFDLLQNVTIAAVVKADEGGAPQALLLTISPQDALVLKYVKDAGGIVDIVLRAPGVDRPFEVEPVDVDYVLNRYQMPIEAGR
jgi:pilus assembly protein CpaB